MALRISFVAVLLFVCAACGGSSYGSSSTPTTPSSPTASGTPVAIVAGASTLTTTAYAPNPVTVSVGGSVTWTNNDTTPHTSVGNTGGWNSGTIAPGGKYTTTFSSAGTFTYHCSLHPGMTGTVTVQ